MRSAPRSRSRVDRRRAATGAGRSGESGYAFLMVLIMVVALLIASQEVMENYATQGRRVREQETIWRGQQVDRAIRLYYHKTGHYPQTFDDLQSGMAELHFLREVALKNPMNQVDGSWRFIYVNSAGQIIGSVKYATLQQMAILDLNHGKIPPVTAGAVPASSLASGGNQSTQNGPQSSASSDNNDFGQLENPLAALKPTGPVDGPVPGAFLTGVGGNTDAKSLIVYNGGKKYLDWEFIWNPIEDQARAMQAQQQSGGATGTSSGGLFPGLTNLPGLPTGLTGTGTSSSGASGSGYSGTPSTTSPNAPSNPAGTPTPPDSTQQNAPPPDSD